MKICLSHDKSPPALSVTVYLKTVTVNIAKYHKVCVCVANIGVYISGCLVNQFVHTGTLPSQDVCFLGGFWGFFCWVFFYRGADSTKLLSKHRKCLRSSLSTY